MTESWQSQYALKHPDQVATGEYRVADLIAFVAEHYPDQIQAALDARDDEEATA